MTSHPFFGRALAAILVGGSLLTGLTAYARIISAPAASNTGAQLDPTDVRINDALTRSEGTNASSASLKYCRTQLQTALKTAQQAYVAAVHAADQGFVSAAATARATAKQAEDQAKQAKDTAALEQAHTNFVSAIHAARITRNNSRMQAAIVLEAAKHAALTAFLDCKNPKSSGTPLPGRGHETTTTPKTNTQGAK